MTIEFEETGTAAAFTPSFVTEFVSAPFMCGWKTRGWDSTTARIRATMASAVQNRNPLGAARGGGVLQTSRNSVPTRPVLRRLLRSRRQLRDSTRNTLTHGASSSGVQPAYPERTTVAPSPRSQVVTPHRSRGRVGVAASEDLSDCHSSAWDSGARAKRSGSALQV